MSTHPRSAVRLRVAGTLAALALPVLLYPGCTTKVTSAGGIGASESHPDRHERTDTDESFGEWFTGDDDNNGR